MAPERKEMLREQALYRSKAGDLGTAWQHRLEEAIEALDAAEQRAQVAEADRDEARKWANCGGVPSGRVCTADPSDHHEIYGGGYTLTDGSFVCTLHALRKAEEDSRMLDWILRNFNRHNDQLRVIVPELGSWEEGGFRKEIRAAMGKEPK